MSEWYTIFVLTFQASMGFSVVKVIMGVFLQNTFSVAANDDVKLGMRRFEGHRCHVRKRTSKNVVVDFLFQVKILVKVIGKKCVTFRRLLFLCCFFVH